MAFPTSVSFVNIHLGMVRTLVDSVSTACACVITDVALRNAIRSRSNCYRASTVGSFLKLQLLRKDVR